MTPEQQTALITLLTTGVAAMATSGLVNLITMAVPDRPTWVPPAAALAFGIAFAILQLIGSGQALTLALAANAIIGGVIIATTASGIVAWNNTAKDVRATAQADAAFEKVSNPPMPFVGSPQVATSEEAERQWRDMEEDDRKKPDEHNQWPVGASTSVVPPLAGDYQRPVASSGAARLG